MLYLLGWLILAYCWLIMMPYAILSWFRIYPGSTLARVQYALSRAVEPVLQPVRRVIPPVGGLDLAFLVVFFGATIIVTQVLWA